MAETGQTVEQATEILQNLQVEAKVVDIAEAGHTLNGEISDDSLEVTTSRAIGDASSTTEAYDGGVDTSMYYAASNGYVGPQAYYYGGYKYSYGDWDEYACQVGLDGILDAQTMAVYNENGSMLYPATGYGYSSQPIYSPYTPAPSARSDGQLYSTQAYKYAGDLHQPSIGAVSASADLGGDDIGGGAFANDSHSSLVQRPGYSALSHPPSGSFVVGAMPPSQQAQNSRSAYSAYRPPAWHAGKRFSQAQPRPGMSPSLPISRVAPDSYRPVSHVVSRRPQYRASAVVPLTPDTLNRASYNPSSKIYASSSPRASPHGFGMSGYDPRWGGRSWVPIDKMRPRGRGNDMLFDANVMPDLLNEQNRGPRIRRLKNQRTYIGSAWLSRSQNVAMNSDETVLGKEQYNRSDFLTNYNFAKFFVIKSYSEDDIHKSIKYNVWASTPNGNKKLAVAYQEAHEKNEHCPVFLLFSVNASGQFCGVAEMVGPVDFNESMGFWQQDKWTGKFSVKWHIIKDVPNNQFRHIIMENNDNKPVTNSRDTQEVKLEHGIEMLNIFKNYTHRTSILDDFQYYDRRQKVMQDKKGKQLSWQLPQQVAALKVTTETDIHSREGDADSGRDLDKKNNVETHVKGQGGDETNPEEVRLFGRASSLNSSDIIAPKVILERKSSPVLVAFSANDSPPRQNIGLTV